MYNSITVIQRLNLTFHSNISQPLPKFHFCFYSRKRSHILVLRHSRQKSLTGTDIQTVIELLYKDENTPDLGYDGQVVWEEQSEM
jgi:hypothetical protein